jgi:hypothetical protein
MRLGPTVLLAWLLPIFGAERTATATFSVK